MGTSNIVQKYINLRYNLTNETQIRKLLNLTTYHSQFVRVVVFTIIQTFFSKYSFTFIQTWEGFI